MKKILPGLLLISLQHFVYAQAGEWTWMKGYNAANSPGIFGTIGVPDVNNSPPAVYGPITWTDLTGKFWLYGGANFNSYVYDALWRFDPDLNIWTWVNGSSTTGQLPVYGTIGVPSTNNHPGARAYGATSWTDLNGNLWFYGGASNIGPGMSDLWMYDIATDEWTCMGNYSFNANHGTKGVAAVNNSPGARDEFTTAWTSNAGDLWFYGGQGGVIMFADVWKYDMSTNELIWMEGDSMSGILPPTYGSLGIFDSTNSPGSRIAYCHWKDASGNFWIYGGGNPYVEMFADLWKFDPVLNEWAWMGGDTTAFYAGNFVATCDTGNSNHPRCATEDRACWRDNAGQMWMMGGALSPNYETSNDLWVYNPSQQQWKWVSGSSSSNLNAVYGTQGVADPANMPATVMGAVSWTDQHCNLWYFGGRNSFYGTNEYNAMWEYVPDSTCTHVSSCFISAVSFQTSQQAICEKFCTGFTDQSTNFPTAWQWLFPGGVPSSSIDQNPANICYNVAGTYDVTLITTNASGNDTLTLHNYITVYPTPPFPTITQVGYTLTSSPAASYQWQFNTVDIPGATNQAYTLTQSGSYTVIVTDSNGCINSSSTKVFLSGIEDMSNDARVSIFPNPANDEITIQSSSINVNEVATISIINVLGKMMLQEKAAWKNSITLEIKNLSSGIYLVKIENGKEKLSVRFVKE